ncbi:hypothetical protein CAL14_05590 [Bordetella genomosp. 9]|uniref:phage tail tape measure protein n=1 Tax=Bordetella genomosp. 9 TaxID=1416803 RepID=UPI000A28E4C1|nr:phage tail tape measure protein [Bordetella genomosp. 9]ARP89827.1 hypothetical protein CAL14_05590 [Bordetella genomosp. 9]
MATAGSIVIDLLMKTGAFETDSKRAAKNLKDLGDSAKRTGDLIGTAFGLGAVASIAGVTAALKSSIDSLDQLADRSQRLGIDTTTLQELQFQAHYGGVEVQNLDSALTIFAKNVSAAAGGAKEQANVFKTLGINVSDASGKVRDTKDILRDIADRFAAVGDGATKTAAAQALFGRSGADLIVMLDQGSKGMDEFAQKARDLGQVIDQNAIEAAGDFNDALDDLAFAGKGLANVLASKIIPPLTNFIRDMREAVEVSHSFASALEVNILDRLFGDSDPEKEIASVTARLNENREALAKLKAEQAANPSGDYTNAFGFKENRNYAGSIAALEQAIAAGEARLKVVQNRASRDAVTMPEVNVSAQLPPIGTGDTKKEVDEGQKLIDQLQKQVDLTGELTERQKLQIQIQQGYVKFQTQGQQDNALALADTLDLINEQNKAYEESQKRAADLAKLLDDLYPSKSVSGEYLKDLTLLTDSLQAGAISASDYYDAVDRLDEKFTETADSMSQFSIQAARNIQDSLGDGLYDLLTGNFDNIGQSWAKMILKMVADAQAAQLAKALFGDYGNSGQIGGLVGSAFGSFFGGASSGVASATAADVGAAGGGLMFLADGGYTGPGGKYDVAGVVHAGEYVINADATRKLGLGFLNRLNGYANGGYVGNPPPASGGPNVQVNLTNQSSANIEATQSSARFDGERYIINVLLKDKMKNGPVSRAFAGGR